MIDCLMAQLIGSFGSIILAMRFGGGMIDILSALGEVFIGHNSIPLSCD